MISGSDGRQESLSRRDALEALELNINLLHFLHIFLLCKIHNIKGRQDN